MEFRDKLVLITGGGHGIGRATAAAFLKTGASVLIAEIDDERGAETVKCLGVLGPIECFVGDIGNPDDVERLFAEITDRYGVLDVLVNNAGIGIGKPLVDLTVEEWDRVMAVNLRAAFLCVKHGLALLRRSAAPAVINIASTRAFMSEPDTEAYTAAKGGLVALTHGMAASLAPDRIRVNAVSPGWIHTGRFEDLSESDHAQHLVGRVGTPEDVAEAVLYLSSPRSGFVTGTNLTLDGGMTVKMIYE